MTKLIMASLFALLALNVAGCGGSSGGSSAPAPNKPQALAGIDQQAFAVGAPYDGRQVVSIDPAALTITFSFPLPSAPVGGAAVQGSVTGLSGATLNVSPDQNGIWAISFTMPLKYLVKGIAYQNPASLPNGQPLPGIPNGQLPMLTVQGSIDGHPVYLYGNNTNFAVFYPTPNWNPGVTLVFPLMDKTKSKTLGYFGVIQAVNKVSGGLYGDIIISSDLQTAINNLP